MKVEVAPEAGAARPLPVPMAAMVLAGVWPLIGVLVLGWDVGVLLVLYWFDNVAVGVWTLVRLLARGAWPLGLFFTFHYGMFMLVHGGFVLVIAASVWTGMPGSFDGLGLRPLLVTVVGPALVALAAHGISAWSYARTPHGRALDVGRIMMAPYPRMVPLHVAIILGGFLAIVLGAGWAVLTVLVVLKTTTDVALHRREHRETPSSRPSVEEPLGV